MKESFQHWLTDNTLVPGVLGCGVRFPDRSSISQSHVDLLPVERLDLVWQRLAETVTTLNSLRLTPTQMSWTFAGSHIHLVLRPDGIHLGLVTTPEASESQAIGALVERFLQFGT
jgi:hypothetical protein